MYSLFRYQPATANRVAVRSPWAGFDQDFANLFSSALDYSDAKRSIPVSVREDKDNLVLTAELPGVAREDVAIEFINDELSLSATRKVVGSEGETTVSYARSFTLPYAVQADKIAAELKDGLLSLTLPKAEVAKPFKVEVK
ncbi:Hsp20/alpha crystallin family protein [Oleiharenicola lentus]|uniref:Hsp20/alpha crystallin family protein n=1 Tax=Oleiharenicola lentus TaxID=2508720 RepID=UPI003F67005B